MPAMDVITGLRGAGKTTVINRILKEGYAGSRISVIQNELGKTALDSALLTGGPESLEQMTGGCVCCTLQTNLLEGIRRQMEAFRPDTVILEAAGEGRPADILKLCAWRADLSPHIFLHVLDGSRFPALLSLMGTTFTAPIRQSCLLYVNRLSVHPERISEVFDRLRELNPDAFILYDAPDLLPETYRKDDRIVPFSVERLFSLAGRAGLPEDAGQGKGTENRQTGFVRMRLPGKI